MARDVKATVTTVSIQRWKEGGTTYTGGVGSERRFYLPGADHAATCKALREAGFYPIDVTLEKLLDEQEAREGDS